MLLAAGEQISISLLAMAIEKLGFHAVSLLGWQAGFETSSAHTSARIKRVDASRIRRELDKKNIVIVAGFQGLSKYGDITTLGRGGSDTSAVAIAAAMHADLCQIFTDVEGVYTADPRKVPNARKLKEISYDEMLELARVVQSRVLEILNITGAPSNKISAEGMRPKVEDALDQALREIRHRIPGSIQIEKFRAVLMDDLIGLGPLSPLLRATDISEIMINGPDNIFVESNGIQYRTGVRFNGEAHLQSIIQRIVEPLGRHIDAASPMVDARLDDGSRVNAVIPPLSLDGSLVTIRKFAAKKLTDEDLIRFGSLSRPMAEFLKEAVRSRRNILVSGGTGSGKTTLLNILSQFIPERERIITVEDSAELKLTHENLCRLEARPANIEGQGRITIRDLVINTLRMRPDRIIVGECRGAEALDMLQAMNTGHDGSMTTCHANNPRDALSRLENMVMMAGFELPSSAIREQIASAINLIVQQTRMPDGSRKIVKITEVCGRENNTILLQDIFTYEQEGYDEKFKVVGRHVATGNIPRFIEELRQSGDLKLDMSVFVPEG